MYIREAHASDVWQLPINERQNVVYASPKTQEERAEVAGACVRNLKIDFPAVLDDFTDSTEKAYTGWPDRLYIVDSGGRIAFKSGPGPWGFSTAALADELARVVSHGSKTEARLRGPGI